MSQTTPSYLHDIPHDWQATLATGNNKSAKPGEWRNKVFDLGGLVRGLTQHTIGPKDGPCFLQGQATGGVRQARAMERLHLIGIDVDNGMPSTEIDEIVKKRGLFCIRYTTHSHGKDYTEVRKDDWIKYRRLNEGADIAEFLVAEKRYLPEVAKQAAIESEVMTSNGIVLKVSHPSMDKNRLIFVLAKPWSVYDYDTQVEALQTWSDSYRNFAAWLGIVVDKSCTDASRLFYLPRREANALYEAVVHEGKAIDVFALPNSVPSRNSSGNVFLDAAAAMGADTSDTRALKSWAAKFGDRFLIYDALLKHADHVLRPEMDREDIHHIECPFEGNHTNFGGSGTFVVNAGESANGGFVIKCMHDSCADKDRLDFLAEMIRVGWLPEDAIYDREFLIEMESDEPSRPHVEPPKPAEKTPLDDVVDGDSADRYLQGLAESQATPVQVASAISALRDHLHDKLKLKITRAELVAAHREFLKDFNRRLRAAEEDEERRIKQAEQAKKADLKEEERIKKEAAKRAAKSKHRAEAVQSEKERVTLFKDTDYLKAVNMALTALADKNDEDPLIFRNSGTLARVVLDEFSTPKIERLELKSLRYEITRVARFMADGGDGGMKEEYAPQQIVEDILSNPSPPFPVLGGIVTAPVFGPDGAINTTPGYDYSSQLYFKPSDGLEIPPVADKPSAEDMAEAIDLLMNNALVDFPFDGPNGGRSEKAHALCMILQPFARQLIKGATPIYLVVKPTPGTGASKLVNIYSLISVGEEATAQTETKSEDEIRKRITSVLLEGSQTFYLDNINYKIDSSALASAVTSSKWTDRLLGASKTVEVPVKHTWIFCGNNPTMSNEIARRCVRIRLDAKVERPELRKGFKHKDLESWVKDNRGKLIWACLTIIQNWIASGKPEPEVSKGSFEPWARVMGGILKCAGFEGFLENDEELREGADEDSSVVKTFVSIWMERYGTTPVEVGGERSLFELYQDEEIPIPVTGNNTASQRVSFGKFMTTIKDRIFTINDRQGQPIKVIVELSDKKKNNKNQWCIRPIDD